MASSNFKEFNLINFANYPDEMKTFVPYNVLDYFKIYKGQSRLDEINEDGVFRMTIKGKENDRDQKVKETVILGRLDPTTDKLEGPYYIFRTRDVINAFMLHSQLSYGLDEAEIKRGVLYQDKATGEMRESGDYKIIFAYSDQTVVDQYQNFKLSVQTQQIVSGDYAYKTTRLMNDGRIYLITTYDVYENPVQTVRTYGVSQNPALVTMFQPSVPDNQANVSIRNFFSLERETPDVSLMSSKINPLTNYFFPGSENNELVITYTQEGVIYSLFITNTDFGSLTLVDQGIVYSDLVDLMQNIMVSQPQY